MALPATVLALLSPQDLLTSMLDSAGRVVMVLDRPPLLLLPLPPPREAANGAELVVSSES